MARKKKVADETQPIDVLAELIKFRDEKHEAAKLTDAARDKFAVDTINEFLEKIDGKAT